MKEKTCCFTGHRELPGDEIDTIKKLLDVNIRHLIKQGITNYCAGGALGFDTLAAKTVIGLKDEFSMLRLILVLPCPEQARRWSPEDILVYEEIKSKADEVIYASDAYYKGCMQKRNRCMVDKSCCCICYMVKKRSGTKSTTEYCRKQGVYVINIAD